MGITKVIPVIARTHQEFTWWVFDNFGHPELGGTIVKQGSNIIVDDTLYVYAADIRSLRGYRFVEWSEVNNCYMRHDYKEIKDWIEMTVEAEKAVRGL